MLSIITNFTELGMTTNLHNLSSSWKIVALHAHVRTLCSMSNRIVVARQQTRLDPTRSAPI